MRIEALSAHSFRNLAAVTLRPQAPCVVLVGDNGQGKTNILEALYLCATGRSFRRAPAKEMVRLGSTHGRCEALIQRQGVRHTVQVDLVPQGPQGAMRQKLTIDGRHVRQTSQLLKLVNVVAFFPDDLRIIKGSPEERRRFFDRATAGGEPAFVDATLSYHRALKARNMLLRGPHSPDRRLIATYDQQLVQHGTAMHGYRLAMLQALSGLAQKFFTELMGQHILRLGLLSGISACDALPPDADATQFAKRFAATLEQHYPRDRARGMTLSGPHRSDLSCLIDDQPARSHASQGQQRALVLALKLAEMVELTQRLQTPPILLLDDVSSELDARRTELLFKLLATLGSQVFVSTTGHVPLPIQTPAQIFAVRAGAIVEQTAQQPPAPAAPH
jgi:DNA replication and repair protein RecF